MRFHPFVAVVLVASMLTACGYAAEYAFSRPDSTYKLPPTLNEISGIALTRGNMMACVEDESGRVYFYSLSDSVIADTVEFAGSGDYEDIAIVGDTAYVLRSDGQLTVLACFRSKPVVQTVWLEEIKKQDAEGICYDAANHRLLIACKGKNNKSGKERSVYACSLDNYRVTLLPELSLDGSMLILKAKGNVDFAPSAIALHPMTGDVYFLSTVGKILVIVTSSGKVSDVIRLDEKIFRQPEGMTFAANGDLYISNEAHGKRGTLLKFKYQN